MSKIILKDFKGESEYEVLFSLETEKDKKYIVFSKNEEEKENKVRAYASSYKFNNKTKKYSISPIKTKKELDLIEKILNSLQIERER